METKRTSSQNALKDRKRSMLNIAQKQRVSTEQLKKQDYSGHRILLNKLKLLPL